MLLFVDTQTRILRFKSRHSKLPPKPSGATNNHRARPMGLSWATWHFLDVIISWKWLQTHRLQMTSGFGTRSSTWLWLVSEPACVLTAKNPTPPRNTWNTTDVLTGSGLRHLRALPTTPEALGPWMPQTPTHQSPKSFRGQSRVRRRPSSTETCWRQYP